MEISLILRNWYRENKRDLPWRNTRNPYYIWLSEIILQQTRVDQGLNYYLNFIQIYPRIEILAAASEDNILKNWQGLGYYSRARNLHNTAKYITSNLNGEFPNKHSEILNLKGVGEYTAAAIASFAYNQPFAVVDGNVFRVLSRLFDEESPINNNRGKKLFTAMAQGIMDPKHPAEHNQAIMEFGAIHCTPAKPLCENCPLQFKCLSYRNGTVNQRPVKDKKTKVVQRDLNYLVLENPDEIIFRKRTEKDIWKGLHDFPELGNPESNLNDMLKNHAELNTLSLDSIVLQEPIEVYKHQLSHQKISARFWRAKTSENFGDNSLYLRVNKNDIESIAIPRLIERFLEKEILKQ